MRKSIVVIAILFCAVCSANRCFAVANAPRLSFITCEKWNTYEDDRLDYIVFYMAKKGITVDNVTKGIFRAEYESEKMIYLTGLSDAVLILDSKNNQKSKAIDLFNVKKQMEQIDNNCKRSESAKTKVAVLFFSLNGMFTSK